MNNAIKRGMVRLTAMAVTAVMAVAIVASGWVVTAQAREITKLTPAEFADEIFRLINEERAAKGLRAFEKADEELTAFAFLRAEEATALYSHTRPNGIEMKTECLAGNFSPEAVVYDWMHSEGHRLAVMSEINAAPYMFYPEMAVGVVIDQKTGLAYCSLEFDRKGAESTRK